MSSGMEVQGIDPKVILSRGFQRCLKSHSGDVVAHHELAFTHLRPTAKCVRLLWLPRVEDRPKASPKNSIQQLPSGTGLVAVAIPGMSSHCQAQNFHGSK